MAEKKETAERSTLTFMQLVRGILAISWRIPFMIKPFIGALNLRDSKPVSMGTTLERNAVAHGERAALLFEDRVISHREFNEAVNQYANYLLEQGAVKGDRVIVMVDNRPELLIIIGAVSKIGAVSSLINPQQRGEVLRHSINLTRGKIFIVGEELLEPFEDIRYDLDLRNDELLLYQKDRIDTPAPDGYIDLTAVTDPQPGTNPDTVKAVCLGDPFAYVFTSGTTGMPKASVQPHRRWISAEYWFAKIVVNLKPGDIHYSTLPFCHTNGLHVAWGSCAAVGATLAFRRKFSASGFWDDIRRFNADSFIYIGEICRYLMNQPPQKDDHLNPAIKMVGNGLRPEIWTSFKKRFGVKYVYELYGAAEAPLIFTNILNMDRSVGLCPTPFAIVKYDIDADTPVLDEKGFMQKVGHGEAGLLVSKISDTTPFVGYTDSAQSNKKILRDVFEKGDIWFDSGDLMCNMGYRHAQFIDRLGDTFRWKGENVSTSEVEKTVNVFPQVSESTAYGVHVQGTEGRAGMAAVIPFTSFGEFDLTGFAKMLNESLPPYAVPRFLRLKKAFETTGTHKIKKNLLRDEGFAPERTDDPLYVMLPGNSEYEPLTPEIHRKILDGAYPF